MARKKGRGRALDTHRPREVQLDLTLIDEAVVEINKFYTTKGLETVHTVGDYSLQKFFGGDPYNFLKRGNGLVTIRKLGKREDLLFGWKFIWNAVAGITQLPSLPAAVAEALPLSHHKLLLSIKGDDTRSKVAEEAVNESLGKWAFEARVKAMHANDEVGSKARRPPLPGFVKAFTARKKVVKTATEAEVSTKSVERFSKEAGKEMLVEMEAQIAVLDAVAVRVCAHIGASLFPRGNNGTRQFPGLLTI